MSLATLSDDLLSADFDAIPIIDLTNAWSSSSEKKHALAKEIRDASLNAGFFYIKNHSVPEQTVNDVFQQSKRFFALDEATKRKVDISKSNGNFRGYQAILSEKYNAESKGDLHEAFNLGLDPSLLPGIEEEDTAEGELRHSENLWPSFEDWSGADEFKTATLQYYSAVLALGQALFPLFALALGLPEDFFDDKIRHPAAIMRLLFYPALGVKEADELALGIGPHTDFECFTILRQDDVPALQVQNRKGQWINAPCIPNTFVINIGDQFARWTNDIFVSTRHRALPASIKDRYSIPFFFGCDHQVPLIPPETCITSDRPAKYEVMTAGAYVHMRLTEAYA